MRYLVIAVLLKQSECCLPVAMFTDQRAQQLAATELSTTPLVFEGVTVIDMQQGRRLATQRAATHLVGADRIGADTISVDTAVSAVQMHNLAVDAFADALGDFVWDGGMLTDELHSPLSGMNALPPGVEPHWPYMGNSIWRKLSSKDVRILPERLSLDSMERLSPLDTGSSEVDNVSREGQLDEGYMKMQGARAYLSTAIEKLATAAPAANPALVKVFRGELYALDGYADIMLADLYCSGVPLNSFAGVRLVLGGIVRAGREESVTYADAVYRGTIRRKLVEYRPSSTTEQVYQNALAKFDTAISLAGDSARILNLARVGKGRVWLALGRYDSAATAVAAVPKEFDYSLRSVINLDPDGDEEVATVADRKGLNGLPYISSGDPRTKTGLISTDKAMKRVSMPTRWWHYNDLSDPMTAKMNGPGFMDSNYMSDTLTREWHGQSVPIEQEQGLGPSNVNVPFTVANWEEAVLIQAEATLHSKRKHAAAPTWLHLLNQLRATASIPGTTQPASPQQLPPLVDPGDSPHDSARVALLFAERGYWLFGGGHRQGDLRRLVRQYHWPQQQVYPTGPYVVPKGVLGDVGHYGTYVNMPIPPEERANPYFHGCLDRGA